MVTDGLSGVVGLAPSWPKPCGPYLDTRVNLWYRFLSSAWRTFVVACG